MVRCSRLGALSAVALAACAPATPTIEGRASVIDGDTFEIHGQRIRLWGVDAPEARQICTIDGEDVRCGRLAAEELADRVSDQVVTCVEEDVDRYGRTVARCSVDDGDLGAWLVEEGLAVRYARYAGAAYMIEETRARHARRGVWRGQFEQPEDWRRRQRRGGE